MSDGKSIISCRQGGNRNRGNQTFPIAFSQVFGVYATRNNNGWEYSVIVSSVSNTGFYSEARNQANDNPYDYWWYWIAFGRG
ncbi:gp53-like domain-containing protein [Dialister succinatiphilus]